VSDLPDPRAGVVAPEVAAELPGIALWELTVPADLDRGCDRMVGERLRLLAGRVTGAVATEARHDEIVHAYRVCFRRVGMDPDVDRTPYEAAMVERLRRGGFARRDVLADALLLALLDTKVAVTAFDERALHGPLRVTLAGDPAALVVADAERAVAPLFGPADADAGVLPVAETPTVRLATVTPPGVPAIAAWEALDRVGGLLAPPT
jgi:hypothetical protein